MTCNLTKTSHPFFPSPPFEYERFYFIFHFFQGERHSSPAQWLRLWSFHLPLCWSPFKVFRKHPRIFLSQYLDAIFQNLWQQLNFFQGRAFRVQPGRHAATEEENGSWNPAKYICWIVTNLKELFAQRIYFLVKIVDKILTEQLIISVMYHQGHRIQQTLQGRDKSIWHVLGNTPWRKELLAELTKSGSLDYFISHVYFTSDVRVESRLWYKIVFSSRWKLSKAPTCK